MLYLGRYVLFLRELIIRREKFRSYRTLFIEECVKVGTNSVFVVSLVSAFLGAVITLQTASNLTAPYIQDFMVALVVRELTILGVAPTVIALVLAGKVGSHTAGELGTMRITEQIDALEVMGINATSYLVLPKVLASTLMYPLLAILATFLSMLGGYLIGVLTGLVSSTDYIYGLRIQFNEFSITYALTKSTVFGFVVSSVSAFKGFYIRGGALEVGKAGTGAVTNSCIAILSGDYILTRIFQNVW